MLFSRHTLVLLSCLKRAQGAGLRAREDPQVGISVMLGCSHSSNKVDDIGLSLIPPIQSRHRGGNPVYIHGRTLSL